MAADALLYARAGNVLLCLALGLYLWRSHLVQVRRAFAYYLCFHGLRGFALLTTPLNRTGYGYVYFATEPIVWLFYVLIVIELYTVALKDLKGIALLSRWVLSGLVGLAVLLSLISLPPDLNSNHPFPIIQVTTAIGRAICTSLALFLLGITAFFLSYPIPLSRNTIVHSAICSVYFLTLAAAYFVHNVVGRESWAVVNLSLVAITGLTLLAWIVLLKPEGERVMIEHRRPWSPETEQHLLDRLNALNTVLARSLRK
ncbi:MAG: hypothetical protein ACP5U2_05320 [Bryobacteraceae bacterium]